jgi:hypothetical protein
MKRELRLQARGMRENGMSVRDITKALNLSKSTVSIWVRDIVLSEDQVEALKANQRSYAGQNAGAQRNREKARQLRIIYQDSGRAKAKEMRPLHMAGCMLYWAEGAKRRNIYFANSDSNMVTLFVRFLRDEMDVTDSEIVIYIHCHTADPDLIREIEDYWVKLLVLSRENLRKTYTKKGSEIKHSILKHGVCGIGVYSVERVQHIFGAIQEYGGFDNPDWLF